ncbi:MAG TPA: AIR synthase-related protein [Chitinophagaceae bacterium]|nr:AIR synthase-related protein [Chitinophagaceae bacterium]
MLKKSFASMHLCKIMSDLYLKRGVSSQKEDVHEAIEGLDKGLFPNAFCKILPDIMGGDNDQCCIMHADTAGTKSILAYLYWKETGDVSIWKGIAQDAMVMNIDDMICAGATGPFVLSSTIARNKHLIPKEVLKAVIQGCETLIREWAKHDVQIHMAGGETADVGDLVKTIDVGYTAFARLAKKDVVQIKPQAGDVIIGFASFGQAIYEDGFNSGIGCNGLTSARHDILSSYYKQFTESYDQGTDPSVCYIGPYRLTDKSPNGHEIGKLLLSPTRTFAPLVKKVLSIYKDQVHGIVHNTGGGLTKCMKFIDTPVRLIKDNLLATPEIFTLIQQSSKASWREMVQVFNMGCRLEMYVPKEVAEAIISISTQLGIEAKIIGRVESAAKKELTIHAGGEILDFEL